MPIRCSVTINAPAERVFAALTELDRLPQWNPNVLVERLDGEPLAIGTRHRHTSGKRIMETQIAHVDRPGRLVVRFDDRRSRGEIEYGLQPATGGTRLDYERRYQRAPWSTRLLATCCPWWIARSVRRSLERLKSYVESA